MDEMVYSQKEADVLKDLITYHKNLFPLTPDEMVCDFLNFNLFCIMFMFHLCITEKRARNAIVLTKVLCCF